MGGTVGSSRLRLEDEAGNKEDLVIGRLLGGTALKKRVAGSRARRRSTFGALAVLLALLLAPAAARATDFPVTNPNDAGAGSLRQAMIDANGNPGPDAIPINVPSPPNTVHLLSALPVINDDVTITGPGQGQFTVSGEDLYQPFKVNNGKTAAISGLTTSHGRCDTLACGFAGGGIRNNGTLTLTGVTVTSNTTNSAGGGIYNSGTMTIENSRVISNTVSDTSGTNPEADGGGIYNAGTMNLVQSTVSGNTASGSGGTGQSAAIGGGIFNGGLGELTIDRSTVGSNLASADALGGTETNVLGGGINNRHNLTIRRSTISNNAVSASNGTTANSARAGGISNVNPASQIDVTVTIARSTLSDNTVTSPGTSQAGGIDIFPGTYTIKSSTIAHNSAASGSNLIIGGTPVFKNTIVSNPAGGGFNCNGSAATTSYDLSSDATCGFTDPTDQLNTDPMLAPSLALNGGPTKTYALQLGSPAIDQGLSSVGETVDQRGKKRPSDFGNLANASGGDGSDIGAFEFQDTTPPNTIIDSGPAGAIHDPTPRFTFHSTEAGSTFQCKVDAHGFAACGSPRTLAYLTDGPHTFQVRAKDLAGNIDPSPASRSFSVSTAEIKRSGSTLVVTAAPGAKDNFKVTKPAATTIRVTNLPAGSFTASGVHVGLGCTRSGDYTANCTASSITKLRLGSGTAPDRALNMTSLPSTMASGAGNDVVIGGAAADTIEGGTGADILQGNNGNDTLLARDLASDTAINCDGGSKPGTSDKAVLDALPKDPDGIVSGCETKSRP